MRDTRKQNIPVYLDEYKKWLKQINNDLAFECRKGKYESRTDY